MDVFYLDFSSIWFNYAAKKVAKKMEIEQV